MADASAWDWGGTDMTPSHAKDVPVFDAQPEELPPLDPGAVALALDWPPDESQVSDLRSVLHAAEDVFRENGTNVKLDLMYEVGPNDLPVVRLSGYHEDVRRALVEYCEGDAVQANMIYQATVAAVGTGSVVGSVEARFDAYGGEQPEYRPNPESPEGEHSESTQPG